MNLSPRLVSIPYEREGTFRLTKHAGCSHTATHPFQFPTNGKAHSDERLQVRSLSITIVCFNSLRTGRHIQTHIRRNDEIVFSISGFQFPTNGKAHSDGRTLTVVDSGLERVSIPYEREGTFRLSSTKRSSCVRSQRCFNSLRTGRHIQTFMSVCVDYCTNYLEFQFPTNGKAHSDARKSHLMPTN